MEIINIAESETKELSMLSFVLKNALCEFCFIWPNRSVVVQIDTLWKTDCLIYNGITSIPVFNGHKTFEKKTNSGYKLNPRETRQL